MTYEQYYNNQLDEATKSENITMTASINPDESIENQLSKFDSNTMVGRTIKGIKYCIFNKKYINLTELCKQIKALYIEKGYSGVGFSKLDDTDFVKYSSSKSILKKIFNSDLADTEIDTRKAAQYFLSAETIEF